MSATLPDARLIQLLADAVDLPLRPEWLNDLAKRWAFFRDEIDRLDVRTSVEAAAMVDGEDE
jgi:hypothetical protein